MSTDHNKTTFDPRRNFQRWMGHFRAESEKENCQSSEKLLFSVKATIKHKNVDPSTITIHSMRALLTETTRTQNIVKYWESPMPNLSEGEQLVLKRLYIKFLLDKSKNEQTHN